ncbi:MAG: hypothetical protein HKN94_17035 [Acidimicrobiales bacterium]|nr:hypothetical protein [Acidimicrobiales bacterium]RZV48849.1 MAG: hypothetical protein EX269_00130 [Acidimicrobiales bacterium]
MRTTRNAIGRLVVVLAMCGVAAIIASDAAPADAANHGTLVGEVPRLDLPVVLDGNVRAHAQVGSRIFVGGDFQQIELPDGTVVTQPYIFAYHIDTGAFDTSFRPVLDKVVRSLDASPDESALYVGGRFTQWDGNFRGRIAKLDPLGNLDPTFKPSVSARVQSIAARNDKVFLGGSFTTVDGLPRLGLAAVDATTGAVDTGFVMDITGSTAGSDLARAVVLTSDGSTLFALHHGGWVNQTPRQALLKVDVSGPTSVMSGWQVNWDDQGNRDCRNKLRDMAISPDDTFIVVGGQGADNPPNCDSVLRYPVAGDTVVTYDWSARMYSSVLSLAVSDVAVYVGGHFCAAPKLPTPPGGVSSTWPGTANACDINDPSWPWNPSNLDPEHAVFRKQLAALNPADAQALNWDPGANAFTGILDLTVIDRGLLLGSDRDRINSFNVGRSGFIDLGGGTDTTPPTVSVTSPADGSFPTAVTSLVGSILDNAAPASVDVQLQDTTSGQWLQTDGTFGATPANLPNTTVPNGLGSLEWTVTTPTLPGASYLVQVTGTDVAGNQSAVETSTFTIPSDLGCTVALNASNQPVVTYTGFEDGAVSTIFVRRDGKWLATVAAGDGTYTDGSAAVGDHSYLVRWRPGGVTTNVPCTPDPVTVPGVTIACTAVLNGDGQPVLTWDAVAGVDNYNVRDNGGWVATTTATTYTDASAVPGLNTYTIRYNMGGQQNITCQPAPIDVPQPDPGGCTATTLPDGSLELNWTMVGSITRYQIRDDGWIATVEDTLTYNIAAPEPGVTYNVRHKLGGVKIDRPCDPA